MKFVTTFSRALVAIVAMIGIGCSGSAPPPEHVGATPEKSGAAPEKTTTTEGTAPASRPQMTAEECKAKGTVVGDIGNGATQRPDYRCADGKAPIGNVASGIEGAVCCPK